MASASPLLRCACCLGDRPSCDFVQDDVCADCASALGLDPALRADEDDDRRPTPAAQERPAP